jgi:uncharacterized protein HemY
VNRAYALLLRSQWQDAEQLAKQVLATDPTDQFAVYIAAEACNQRNDADTARKYTATLDRNLVTDPALAELGAVLAPRSKE